MFGRKAWWFLLVVVLVTGLMFAGCDGDDEDEEIVYPQDREIDMVVPWGEGGMTDRTARNMAPMLEDALGEAVVVENRSGASGGIGTEFVAEAQPDGHTLLFTAETPAGVLQVQDISNTSFDDFEVIKVLTMGVPVIAVHADAEWDTLEEFIEYARENPGEIDAGHAGAGTSGHIAMLMLEELGVEMNEIPYDGGGPAVTATLGGEVDVNFQSPTEVIEYVRAGDLKILGAFDNETLPFEGMEDVEPLGEAYPEVSDMLPWGPWYGLVAPEGTPDEIVNTLRDAVDEVIAREDWQEFVEEMMAIELYYDGEEAEEFIEGWQSTTTWLLYDAGAAEKSPEEFGIPRP